ncbi:MAG: protein phosphatase 2C domain-containing protein [Congregibacter sp.]|nr:protein phosphatase 2C domain-containing protein [Congregibacter sp.]
MIPFAATTHPGLRREKNEDNFEADEALGLWVVADGVGGHSNGEVASAIACATIREGISKGVALTRAIENAHQAVLGEINVRDAGNNMGTTVVALRVTGNDYEVAWVGDSRAYLYDGKLKRLTRDHSAVNDLLDSGAITADQAASHPQRHALTRSLGVSVTNASRVSSVTGRFKAGQQLLLCTDGLTDELTDQAIENELAQSRDPQTLVDSLLAAALAKGGRDNLTLIVLGSPRRKGRSKKEAAPDLATTQNIAARVQPKRPNRYKAVRLSLMLLVLVAIAAAVMLITL